MFCILAEARSEAPNSFKPKGKIPFNELSTWVRSQRTYLIGEYKEEYGGFSGDCTLKDAIRYQKEFDCRIHYVNKNPIFVDDPDSHNDTWLSYSEYAQALHYYEDYTKNSPPIGYLAVYAVMKTFNDAGYETRLVIWFDN